MENNHKSFLKGKSCTFVKSVAKLDGLPDYGPPEIGFVGRSNVGKSSLINALVEVNGLARTSNTPGRTQHLNFFNWDERVFLVDMPGYGYAKAPKSIVEEWHRLIESYLKGRPTLLRTYLLIDARHGIKKIDDDIMTMLDKTATSYQVVLTKVDKISPSALVHLEKATVDALQKHGAAYPLILSTSSEKHKGIQELRESIELLLIERGPQDDIENNDEEESNE
jgi:GTP-binding protein